jgi:hypothetical protein
MSTSVYLCDKLNLLAFELGSATSYEDFPLESVLSVDDALRALKSRPTGGANLLDLATHVHKFAKAAQFDVELRMGCELPMPYTYEGGV